MPPRSYSSKAPAGTEAEEEIISTEGVTFTLDDVEFTCHGQLDAQDFIDLAGPLMDAGDGWFDPEALAAVARFYRLVLGDESHRAFSAHRRRHRTPPSVVAQIMTDLIEEITARPPGRLSHSPGGPPRTAASSQDGSPSPGSPPAPGPDLRTREIIAALQSQEEPVRAVRSPAGPALDPEGILPPEWADEADVVLAPAPDQVPAAMIPADPTAGLHRTINLGRPGPPAVRSLTETERAQVAAAAAASS
jgi:hypothetical protein